VDEGFAHAQERIGEVEQCAALSLAITSPKTQEILGEVAPAGCIDEFLRSM
jgi:hypothetical protein